MIVLILFDRNKGNKVPRYRYGRMHRNSNITALTDRYQIIEKNQQPGESAVCTLGTYSVWFGTRKKTNKKSTVPYVLL